MRAGTLAPVLGVCLAGCGFSSSVLPDSPSDATGATPSPDARGMGSSPGDAAIDAAVDAATDAAIDAGHAQPSALCLGSFLGICVAPPTAVITLTAPLNTSTSSLCVAHTPAPGAPA
jgi:hypothetical protein